MEMDYMATFKIRIPKPIVVTNYAHNETDNSYQTPEENGFTETSESLNFPLEANTSYECFGTETGDNVVITIDIQNTTQYIIFPGANYVELEVNGKGDALIEFIIFCPTDLICIIMLLCKDTFPITFLSQYPQDMDFFF